MTCNLNTNVLQTCYNQYFCDISHFTPEEILTFHFKFKEAIYSDIYMDWGNEQLEDYIIWEPFEDTLPNNIYDNVISLYNDIVHLLKVDTEELVTHMAADIAEGCLIDYFTNDLGENFEYTDENGDTRLNDDAQLIFNNLYSNFKLLGEGQVAQYETIDMW